MTEKSSVSYMDSPAFRGYMPLGVEHTAGKLDVREQIEYAVETPSTPGCSNQAWPPYERLRGVNPWPDSFQPTLRESTMSYVAHAVRIATCIRQAVCLALGFQDTDAFNELFQGRHEGDVPHWVLKLLSYPPTSIQKVEGDTESKFGVGSHTDTNFLTLALQDNIGGLQVFTCGSWVDVTSHHGPSVLVCNIGEQAELLSNGYFLATPHRVLRNPSNTKERISVPLFYNPPLTATIAPITLPPSLPWERERSDETQYWRTENNAMLHTVGDNTFKSLARSHPVAFQRHHADLEVLPDGQIFKKSY